MHYHQLKDGYETAIFAKQQLKQLAAQSGAHTGQNSISKQQNDKLAESGTKAPQK